MYTLAQVNNLITIPESCPSELIQESTVSKLKRRLINPNLYNDSPELTETILYLCIICFDLIGDLYLHGPVSWPSDRTERFTTLVHDIVNVLVFATSSECKDVELLDVNIQTIILTMESIETSIQPSRDGQVGCRI